MKKMWVRRVREESCVEENRDVETGKWKGRLPSPGREGRKAEVVNREERKHRREGSSGVVTLTWEGRKTSGE